MRREKTNCMLASSEEKHFRQMENQCENGASKVWLKCESCEKGVANVFYLFKKYILIAIQNKNFAHVWLMLSSSKKFVTFDTPSRNAITQLTC